MFWGSLACSSINQNEYINVLENIMVKFEHTTRENVCIFNDKYLNTTMWTVLFDSFCIFYIIISWIMSQMFPCNHTNSVKYFIFSVQNYKQIKQEINAFHIEWLKPLYSIGKPTWSFGSVEWNNSDPQCQIEAVNGVCVPGRVGSMFESTPTPKPPLTISLSTVQQLTNTIHAKQTYQP